MRLPTRKSELWNNAKRQDDPYMTPEAIERLKRELERLIKVERSPAAEEVARTAQMGDLSENAAYQDAKQNLRRINGRITSIEEKLKRAVPIDTSASDGTIRIGSTVTVHVNGKQHSYQILGSLESNPAKGRISHASPLGAALIGHKAGQSVVLKTPSAETTYDIIEIT